MVVNDTGTRPMVFGKSVNPSIQRPIMANDHEASSSSSKKEATTPTCSGEGAGVQEAEGQTIQPLHTYGPSGQSMEGQSS